MLRRWIKHKTHRQVEKVKPSLYLWGNKASYTLSKRKQKHNKKCTMKIKGQKYEESNQPKQTKEMTGLHTYAQPSLAPPAYPSHLCWKMERTRHKRKLAFKVHQEVPKGLNKHWDEKTNSGSNRQANKAGELEPTLCVCCPNLIPVGCRCECLSHLSKVCPAFCLFEQLEQAPPTTLNWTNVWGNG